MYNDTFHQRRWFWSWLLPSIILQNVTTDSITICSKSLHVHICFIFCLGIWFMPVLHYSKGRTRSVGLESSRLAEDTRRWLVKNLIINCFMVPPAFFCYLFFFSGICLSQATYKAVGWAATGSNVYRLLIAGKPELLRRNITVLTWWGL